eukprot:1536679-Pyramimonas_sp.AAC.3
MVTLPDLPGCGGVGPRHRGPVVIRHMVHPRRCRRPLPVTWQERFDQERPTSLRRSTAGGGSGSSVTWIQAQRR